VKASDSESPIQFIELTKGLGYPSTFDILPRFSSSIKRILESGEKEFPSDIIQDRLLAWSKGQSGRALIRLLSAHFPRNIRREFL